MQVTETQADGLKREFKVTVAAKDIDEKLELRLQELGQQVSVPGFRPGKVPLAILKQRYGPSVMGEILEKAVRETSAQTMDERGLRPAMQPKIEITAFDKGKDLEYTMAVELMPEITVMDLSKVALERVKVAVPDEQVEEALQRIAASQKKTEALAEPRPAASGDVVVLDFKGTVDGEELPGMVGEDHHLELGSSRFIEGFEEQLVGAAKGEERQVTVRFPDQYVNDKLAGREARFEVTVKDVLASVPHPIDESLAETLGETSLDQVRERLREQIERDYGRLTRAKLKRAVLDRLAESHDFPVPPGMVELEFEAIWQQIEQDRKQGEVDPEDAGKGEDELKAEYRAIAERRVRLGLLLSEIGRLNGIDVSQEEVNQALLREVRNYPGQEREVLEHFRQHPEALANLRAPLFEDKVIDFIVDLADVTERPLSPEELTKELQGESGHDHEHHDHDAGPEGRQAQAGATETGSAGAAET